MEIIYWSLAIYSITQIITESYLFKPFRDMWIDIPLVHKFVNCFLCTSVWTAMVSSWLLYSPYIEIFNGDTFIINRMFWDGMFGSGVVWFMHLIENKLSS